MSDLEAELERLRRKVDAANSKLLAAVYESCPGPHVAVQHRDMKPPWCPVCGRTDRGVMAKGVKGRMPKP